VNAFASILHTVTRTILSDTGKILPTPAVCFVPSPAKVRLIRIPSTLDCYNELHKYVRGLLNYPMLVFLFLSIGELSGPLSYATRKL
jgi:hypothetical protein